MKGEMKMPVAKTYASMEIQGEPFTENKRTYVNVITPKGLKKVRWYSNAEYKRMYPDVVVENDVMDFDARTAFGFGAEGYIFIYHGQNVEEWAENDRTNIWRNNTFDYYTPGRYELPSLNSSIEARKLKWEDVAAEGNKMKPHEEVRKIIAAMWPENSNSEYQGQVNDWLQKEVTIREKKSKDSRYGEKHTYILEDTEDNTYVWETGAKDYPIAQTISLKMKVKEHKEIDGKKMTVVWYCKEV
jgi:hypothetical protein